MPSGFKIADVSVEVGGPLFLISGPCVVESRGLCMEVAESVAKVTEDLSIQYIF